MFGRHNVQNALVAVAISLELGVADAQVRRGLAAFGGVKRRFTKTGEVAGVAIIDDYGHHPVEISAVLAAARSVATGRVVAVAQPHRYSRLRDHLDEFCTCFNDADHVIIAPVYAAGEAPIDGIDHETLAEGLIAHGHKSVQTIDVPKRWPPPLRRTWHRVISLSAWVLEPLRAGPRPFRVSLKR